MKPIAITPNEILPAPDDLMNQLVNAIASVIVVKVRDQVSATEKPTRQLAAPAVKPGYMTVDEAAEYLRCKRQRVYNLLHEQHIDRYKDGKRVLIRRDQIEMWISGVEQAAAGAGGTRVGRPRSR